MDPSVGARKILASVAATATVLAFVATGVCSHEVRAKLKAGDTKVESVTIRQNMTHDMSLPLKVLFHSASDLNTRPEPDLQNPASPITPPVITVPQGAETVEQKSQGTRSGAKLVDSFDGLGVGFTGP